MLSLVAGHHRACPSATLDKSISLFGFTYTSIQVFYLSMFYFQDISDIMKRHYLQTIID